MVRHAGTVFVRLDACVLMKHRCLGVQAGCPIQTTYPGNSKGQSSNRHSPIQLLSELLNTQAILIKVGKQ
jgi:hypothetical protein